MPKPQEVASIKVKGKTYKNWQTVSVTRSGVDLFPKFAFTAAAPAESAPDFASMKLGIGDPCEVILGGRRPSPRAASPAGSRPTMPESMACRSPAQPARR
ncbi:hypothetical protein M6G65_18595 [Methylobacterium tardum]|uniref:hypothetical protein n=1 Tax=Methylobacterium tardum TaxID=374432 RepID=UPI002022235D|nr:hypothetical protein [Methylobacterium tardum]URD34606.1 hypothetical protein M6G65_18595 [Methylobacterium tardum]